MEMVRSIWLSFASLLLSLALSCCHGARIPLMGMLVLSKDLSSDLYTVALQPRSLPPKQQQLKLILDLSNAHVWTAKCKNLLGLLPVPCSSRLCASSAACNAYSCSGGNMCSVQTRTKKKICRVFVTNPGNAATTSTELWRGKLLLDRTNGTNPFAASKSLLVPDFPFACAAPNSVRLPALADGVFGLSRAQISIPQVLSRHFGFPPTFTYCLPQYGGEPTPIFFGGGSSPTYHFLQNADISIDSFRFTPLLTFKEAPDEYFIQVNSISIGVTGGQLPINKSLFNINWKTGRGGVRISTTERYTRLEPSIYKALSKAFVEKAAERGITRVAAVTPFKTCFNATRATFTRIGYNVPTITFGLRKAAASTTKSDLEPIWEMYGLNTVVSVGNDEKVICLAFLETKPYEKRSIIVGTFQQHDRLVRYDLRSNVFGFTFNLQGIRTRCANFNFTRAS